MLRSAWSRGRSCTFVCDEGSTVRAPQSTTTARASCSGVIGVSSSTTPGGLPSRTTFRTIRVRALADPIARRRATISTRLRRPTDAFRTRRATSDHTAGRAMAASPLRGEPAPQADPTQWGRCPGVEPPAPALATPIANRRQAGRTRSTRPARRLPQHRGDRRAASRVADRSAGFPGHGPAPKARRRRRPDNRPRQGGWRQSRILDHRR